MSELHWQEAGHVSQGSLAASINRSIQENVNVYYSIRLGRRGVNGKLSQFLRPEDMADLGKISHSITIWIHNDISTIRENAKNQGENVANVR